MVKTQPLLITAITLVFLIGTMGVAAAEPGEGPPDELPGPVPDFVPDLLGAISDFIGGAISMLGEALRSITPNTVAG